MPNVNEFLQFKYVRKEDIRDQIFLLKIKGVTVERFGGDDRLVVYFDRARKGMLLDRDTITSLGKDFGEHTDLWVGAEVEVLVERKFRRDGTSFEGVTVRKPLPKVDGAEAELPF
ncbi:MAG: hypothetical protein A3E78_11785 [Alphaproteobacteria bacterium RIFCSPHIGHO2_12_FULL_63_12]|nr:MAG: hypothetical protein A3E78_11785 [Alphaproteobacteria bacterium RIFCSPHIGHO2_12_FULL_63_12]